MSLDRDQFRVQRRPSLCNVKYTHILTLIMISTCSQDLIFHSVLVLYVKPRTNAILGFTSVIFYPYTVSNLGVMLSATESVLVSGSRLTLSCSIIQPSSVTTLTTVMFSWTAPNSVYNRVHTVNATSMDLVISSVETADSGDYVCLAKLTDSSGRNNYIVDSEPITKTISIIVSKCIIYCFCIRNDGYINCSTELNVTIIVDVIPAPGKDHGSLGPNAFTAGSELTLNCLVQGYSQQLYYAWSVTDIQDTGDCSYCDINTLSTASTLTVGVPEVRFYSAGIYTCTVRESTRPYSWDNDHFTVRVIGETVLCPLSTGYPPLRG